MDKHKQKEQDCELMLQKKPENKVDLATELSVPSLKECTKTQQELEQKLSNKPTDIFKEILAQCKAEAVQTAVDLTETLPTSYAKFANHE